MRPQPRVVLLRLCGCLLAKTTEIGHHRANFRERDRIERRKSQNENKSLTPNQRGDKYTDEGPLGALRSPIRDAGNIRNMRRSGNEGSGERDQRVRRRDTSGNEEFPELGQSPRTHKYTVPRKTYTTTTVTDYQGSRKSLWGGGDGHRDSKRQRRVMLGPGEELETDEAVLARKQKTIDYGKSTPGYKRYCLLLPKNKRRKTDPKTPEKLVKCTRRSWDQQIKIWRKNLHVFDPPENAVEDWENLDPGDAFDIDVDTCDELSSICSTDTATQGEDSDVETPSPDEARANIPTPTFTLPCPFIPQNVATDDAVAVFTTDMADITSPSKNTRSKMMSPSKMIALFAAKMKSPPKMASLTSPSKTSGMMSPIKEVMSPSKGVGMTSPKTTQMMSPSRPKRTVTLNWRASLNIDDSCDSFIQQSEIKITSSNENSQDSTAKFPTVPPFDFTSLKGAQASQSTSFKPTDFSSHADEMSESNDGFNSLRRSPRKRASNTASDILASARLMGAKSSAKSLTLDYDLKGLSWADIADSSNSNN